MAVASLPCSHDPPPGHFLCRLAAQTRLATPSRYNRPATPTAWSCHCRLIRPLDRFRPANPFYLLQPEGHRKGVEHLYEIAFVNPRCELDLAESLESRLTATSADIPKNLGILHPAAFRYNELQVDTSLNTPAHRFPRV